MLDEMVFRTEDVPAAERLSYWAERVGQTYAPVRMTSDHAHDFRATRRVLDLGAVSVWQATFQQLVIQRTPKLIRQSDPELFHVSLVVGGAGACVWEDHKAVYRPSDLHISDSSVPWEIRTGKDPVTVVGLQIPQSMLPLSSGMACRAVPRRMPSREGIGALLAQFLTQLIADTARYQPSDGPRLGVVLSDLVTALVAHALESDNAVRSDPRRRVLIRPIKNFILGRLHDPHLTPAVIANAHHISVGHLHRLFATEEATVAAWIRLQRLEAARRDLTDPALHSTPIRAIAARWGFPRAADFSRAFRATYGIPPKDYRHRVVDCGTRLTAKRLVH
ncbi:helix-turn-helix domain-containing protein [Streptomyces lydicamycinicus]|uniref:AraC-like ligand-binding domain-containing protein n=1 Tax=Streptomyces lydicamycinicus TaxID=1546107 RepID=UPI003C2AD430